MRKLFKEMKLFKGGNTVYEGVNKINEQTNMNMNATLKMILTQCGASKLDEKERVHGSCQETDFMMVI